MIRFCGGLTKRPLDALNCFTCSHFSVIKKKEKTTTKSTRFQYMQSCLFLCFLHLVFFFLFFLRVLFIFYWSAMIAVGAQSLRGVQIKSPGTCECTHVLRPPASSAEPSPAPAWARRSLIKSPPGARREGRECVYYNTFAPYTMFSLWPWLSPVGPSRSQPSAPSLGLWGLIRQTGN